MSLSLLGTPLTISYPHKLTAGFARDFSSDLILVAITGWVSRVAKGEREDRGTHETLRVAGHARPVSRSRFARHCTNLVRPRFPAITQHAFTHYARITCDARESTGRCVCRAGWTRRGNRRLCNPYAGTSLEKVLSERSWIGNAVMSRKGEITPVSSRQVVPDLISLIGPGNSTFPWQLSIRMVFLPPFFSKLDNVLRYVMPITRV